MKPTLTNPQISMLRRIRNFNGLLISGAYDDARVTKALHMAGLICIAGVEWKITPEGLEAVGFRPSCAAGS